MPILFCEFTLRTTGGRNAERRLPDYINICYLKKKDVNIIKTTLKDFATLKDSTTFKKICDLLVKA